ncbi:MAG: class I SAM-dependent methyltransferase [Candidatus Cloacimonetes bacterium]|nr:class I SAM-dependent methyltransferase [Candidatus Cloacimonadota bacterium]
MKNRNEIEANKQLWEELTEVHLKGSETYPVKAFKAGLNVLNEIELEEVADVTDKKLLHLQCHFGMDTISWARLGARVTGVDFSEKAIDAARELSKGTDIKAEFINSDIFSLPKKLNDKFDIVFASYGALYWIPDIEKWCQVASHFLKKGGFLYIIDGHPFHHWIDRDETETDLSKFKFSYFDRGTQRYESCSDYADESYQPKATEFGWHFTIGDLINTTIISGLQINFFNEFPFFKIKKHCNEWKPIGESNNYPVMFSIKATKR